MYLYKPNVCEPVFEFISNVNVAIVDISPEEYAVCEDFSHKMWANKKTGSYGRGMINNDDDPRRVERTGILGEMSVAKILDLPINVSYMEGGDQQDFIINGLKTDVKTATRNYGALLIRATYSENPANRVKLDKDIYISTFIINEDRENKIAKLGVVGYIDKSSINESYLKRARYKFAKHWNWDVPYSSLNNIQSLMTRV